MPATMEPPVRAWPASPDAAQAIGSAEAVSPEGESSSVDPLRHGEHTLPLAFVSVLFVVTAVFCTYAPILISPPGEWEYIEPWDDASNFIDNPLLAMPLADTWQAMLVAERINVYEPLAWVLKSTVRFGGWWNLQGESGFDTTADSHRQRLAALGLHAVASALLAVLAERVLRQAFCCRGSLRRWVASALGAALWGCHPLTVEVVAWPSAQPYALAALLGTAALVAHDASGGASAAGPFLYLLAGLAKSIALPLPAAVLALDLITGRAKASYLGQYAIQRIGWVIVAVPLTGLTLWANEEGADPLCDAIELPHLHQRARKAALSVCTGFANALWPSSLRVHVAVKHPDTLLRWADADTNVVLAVAACIVVTLIAAADGTDRALTGEGPPLLFAGWLHVAAFWLPVCGVVQHGMVHLGGDRYMYFPAMAAVPAVAAIVYVALRCRGGMRSRLRTVCACACVAAVAATLLSAEGAVSRSLLPNWRNTTALFEAGVAADPHDWRMLEMYAEYRVSRLGDKEGARVLVERAIQLMPPPNTAIKTLLDHGKNHIILGDMGRACGLYSSASSTFGAKVLELPAVLNNVAICNLYSKRVEDKVHAGAMLERAATLAKRKQHVRVIGHNLDTYRRWKVEAYAGKELFSFIF